MHVNSDDPMGAQFKDAEDPVEIGDVLGYALDPDIRMAKVVGFSEEEGLSGLQRVVFRMYQDHDDEEPTGEYGYKTMFIVAWTGKHRSFAETP